MKNKLALLAATGAISVCLPSAAQADENYYPSASNGKRIYMSPARHNDSGSRGECNGVGENTMAYYNSLDASTGSTASLTGRGYTVRLGTTTYQEAVTNSNAWGADRHIVLHSNAIGGVSCSYESGAHGTWVMHYETSTTGKAVATSIKNAMGPKSPGTGDRVCANPRDKCISFTAYELRYTSAPAAYIEAEFHDWGTGANWLWDDLTWQTSIAEGVDAQMGRPR